MLREGRICSFSRSLCCRRTRYPIQLCRTSLLLPAPFLDLAFCIISIGCILASVVVVNAFHRYLIESLVDTSADLSSLEITTNGDAKIWRALVVALCSHSAWAISSHVPLYLGLLGIVPFEAFGRIFRTRERPEPDINPPGFKSAEFQVSDA
jgi:hypothetical protein